MSCTSLLRLVLPVPPPDQRRAVVAFALFFFFMVSYYVFKPVRSSLYIHYVGAENLPYGYMASVVLSLAAMTIYNRAFVRLAAARLLPATVHVLCGCVALFWALHHYALIAPGLLSVLFFLWVSLYGVLASTLFWSVSNDSFDTATGQRVYGFVGIGGIAGAFAGSLLTEQVVTRRWLQTENLLPVGALVLLGTLPLMRRLRRDRPQPVSPVASSAVDDEARPRRDGWRWILRDGYVGGMAALVFGMTFVGTLLDLQYNRVVDAALPGKEAKTAYFGRLYGMVNALAAAIQLLVTGPLHRRAGPLPGLYPLPLVGLVAPLVLLVAPRLTPVTAVWTVGMALLYSLNQASKELLYLPTPPDVKYGAKAYIDVFFFRLGDSVASLVALAIISRAGALLPNLLCVALAASWLLLVTGLGRGYRRRIASPGSQPR